MVKENGDQVSRRGYLKPQDSRCGGGDESTPIFITLSLNKNYLCCWKIRNYYTQHKITLCVFAPKIMSVVCYSVYFISFINYWPILYTWNVCTSNTLGKSKLPCHLEKGNWFSTIQTLTLHKFKVCLYKMSNFTSLKCVCLHNMSNFSSLKCVHLKCQTSLQQIKLLLLALSSFIL